MSSLPKARTVSSTARRQSAARLTSARMNVASPPCCLICRTTASPRCWFRPVIATFAPSLENSSAVASPMPEVPPVMRATLPFRRMRGILPAEDVEALLHRLQVVSQFEFWLRKVGAQRGGTRSISPVCDEGNDIAIGISHLKISSTPGLLGERLSELHASRLEFIK